MAFCISHKIHLRKLFSEVTVWPKTRYSARATNTLHVFRSQDKAEGRNAYDPLHCSLHIHNPTDSNDFVENVLRVVLKTCDIKSNITHFTPKNLRRTNLDASRKER